MSDPKNNPPQGDRDHCAFAVIFRQRLLPAGKPNLEFLVIFQEFNRKLQMKFPGGRSLRGDGLNRESHEQTMVREVKGEAGLSVPFGAAVAKIVDSSREGYDRVFFVIEHKMCHGEIRNQPMDPRDPEYDEEIRGTPEWRTLEEILGCLHPAHRDVFVKLLNTLVDTDPFVKSIVESRRHLAGMFKLEP